MPPYFILALIMSCIWIILLILRKDMRTKMLVMSFAVIPFAFFDYFSQPSYWHPQTFLSIPVGIEGVLFGFSFGGVAAVLYSTKYKQAGKFNIDTRRIAALSPVLIISIGLWLLFDLNMMITLPLGLFSGCLVIILMKPHLIKNILYSGLYFGLLYSLVLSIWLQLFPQAQEWWDLRIYGDITVLNVPLGEVLFGFLFSAFWSAAYEFVLTPSEEKFTQRRKDAAPTVN